MERWRKLVRLLNDRRVGYGLGCLRCEALTYNRVLQGDSARYFAIKVRCDMGEIMCGVYAHEKVATVMEHALGQLAFGAPSSAASSQALCAAPNAKRLIQGIGRSNGRSVWCCLNRRAALQDDHTLKDCGVCAGATLSIYVKVNGGMQTTAPRKKPLVANSVATTSLSSSGVISSIMPVSQPTEATVAQAQCLLPATSSFVDSMSATCMRVLTSSGNEGGVSRAHTQRDRDNSADKGGGSPGRGDGGSSGRSGGGGGGSGSTVSGVDGGSEGGGGGGGGGGGEGDGDEVGGTGDAKVTSDSVSETTDNSDDDSGASSIGPDSRSYSILYLRPLLNMRMLTEPLHQIISFFC